MGLNRPEREKAKPKSIKVEVNYQQAISFQPSACSKLPCGGRCLLTADSLLLVLLDNRPVSLFNHQRLTGFTAPTCFDCSQIPEESPGHTEAA